MKITLVGVGSFVFGPSALHDALFDRPLPDLHLALVDPNAELVELMAAVARRMARDASRNVRISTHHDWPEALTGSDFVMCAAAVQIRRRFGIDLDIVRKTYPEHLTTEFGGICGISYTLRQVAMITRLATDMRRECPGAWLLCSSNPLPRVCQAAHEMGIRTAGFCSNSSAVFRAIGRLMLDEQEAFPWPKASQRFDPIMAGTNHLTFLLRLVDRVSGEDRTAEFNALALRPDGVPASRTRVLLEETGYFPPNGDQHMHDFLTPDPSSRSSLDIAHGSDDERQQRIELLRGGAENRLPVTAILDRRSWERPVDFAAAMTTATPLRFTSMNLVNEGQIPNLPAGVFVETPAEVGPGGPIPMRLALPNSVVKYCRPAAELNRVLTSAAMRSDRKTLRQAVEMDPTILDKTRGWRAMEQCLAAHADLIGDAW